MKKFIKRLILILLVLFIIFYVYRWGIFLYAYNKIDKNIAQKLSGEYAIKMTYGNGNTMKMWYGEKYAKRSIFVKNPVENSTIGETADTWFDLESGISIFESEGNQLTIYVDENSMSIPINLALSEFATGGVVQSIKESWTHLESYGLLGALDTTFVMPLMMVSDISTEEIDGKEYFVVEEGYSHYKKYIDKETYLPFKMVNEDNSLDKMYEFSFESITKESLEFPNLENYFVKMQ